MRLLLIRRLVSHRAVGAAGPRRRWPRRNHGHPSSVRQSRKVWLTSRNAERADGSWDDYTGYSGGVSCLCTLALLNCGVPLEDPQMHKALEFVRSLKAEKTYVVSLETMVMCLAEPKRDLLHIKNNVQWLEDLQNQPDLKEKDPRRGSWTYMPDFTRATATPRIRNSRCWLCMRPSESACPSRSDTWRLALDYWVRQQNNDGSWSYFPARMPGTGSMTCAGIAVRVHRLGPIERGRCGSHSAGTQMLRPTVGRPGSGRHRERPGLVAATISPCTAKSRPGSLGQLAFVLLVCCGTSGRHDLAPVFQ